MNQEGINASHTTIGSLLVEAGQQLQQAGIRDSEVEATMLVQEVLGLNRSQLFLHGARPVAGEQVACFRQVLARRCRREPLHYIFGSREFWSLEFFVSPAVLVPRPETEFLLDHVFATLGSNDFFVRQALDMCTGSGIIGVVLATELDAPILAVDRSLAALTVARANVEHHGLKDRVWLLCADLFAALVSRPSFDLIVTNPPYIADSDLETLAPEVSQWEPRLALAGGPDGLAVIRRMAADAASYLRPGGWLFMEIGADQSRDVVPLFTRPESGYRDVEVVPDWAGRSRVLQARKA